MVHRICIWTPDCLVTRVRADREHGTPSPPDTMLLATVTRVTNYDMMPSMAKPFSVQRSVTIEASVGDVYGHIVDLKKWNAWSPWADLDPEMSQEFGGPPQGVGQSMVWNGNRKVGRGSMTITDTRPDERVALDLAFMKPFKATNMVDIDLIPHGEATEVQWVMRGELNLVMQAISKVKSMDAMVGPDFERGLANLKRVAE